MVLSCFLHPPHPLGNLCFFFRGMTRLQYIEDSEPIVDGSRNHWRTVQWVNRNKLKVQTKLQNQINKKATASGSHGRGVNPYTDCRLALGVHKCTTIVLSSVCIAALRMAVQATQPSKAHKTHKHEFGPETYDKVSDQYTKTCTTCSHSVTFEKMWLSLRTL